MLDFAHMHKSLLVAVGVMAAIALLVWFFTSSPATLQNTADTATTSTLTTESGAEPTTTKVPAKPADTTKAGSGNTYKSLLTQAGSYQCDYDQVQSTGKSHNVIYIYGGKMRGEFRTSQADGSTSANLFVYDGHYLYQWKEGSSVGTRTVLTSLSQLPLIIPKDLTSGAIVGNSYESVGWLCRTWLTNKALLTPPSYVNFSG